MQHTKRNPPQPDDSQERVRFFANARGGAWNLLRNVFDNGSCRDPATRDGNLFLKISDSEDVIALEVGLLLPSLRRLLRRPVIAETRMAEDNIGLSTHCHLVRTTTTGITNTNIANVHAASPFVQSYYSFIITH